MNRSLAAILLLATLSLRAMAAMVHPAGVLCIPRAEGCQAGAAQVGHEPCCAREAAAAAVVITCTTPCHDNCNGCLDVDLPHDPMHAGGGIEKPRLVKSDAFCPLPWLVSPSIVAAERPFDRVSSTGRLVCLHAAMLRATRLLI